MVKSEQHLLCSVYVGQEERLFDQTVNNNYNDLCCIFISEIV